MLDVDAMLQGMSASQLDDWADFYKKHGFMRDNLQYMLGQFCSLYYNMNRGKKSKALQPGDFYPQPPEKPKQDTGTLVGRLKSFFSAFGSSK